MEKMESLLISLLVILPLLVLIILMVQKRRGSTIILSCAAIGIIVATILESDFQQHPHMPVPIWAMIEVVLALIVPVLAVLTRFIIDKTGKKREAE